MGIKSVLLAVSNQRIVEDLAHFACQVVKEEKGKLYALFVLEVPHSLPLDADLPEEMQKGEEILSRVEETAEDLYNVPVETEVFQARRAGPAILEMALEKKVDLLIIGATLKATFTEKLFGSTVEYLLKKAPCKVMVIRPNKEVLERKGA